MDDTDLEVQRQLMRAEYHEMPGLKLTAAQASRFWNLGPEDSKVLLETLVAQGFLVRTRDGHYVLLAGSHLS
jgi:hypothetical protein